SSFIDGLVRSVQRPTLVILGEQDILRAVQEAIETLRFLYSESDIRLSVHRKSSSVKIEGAVFDLTRALSNVLENAIVANEKCADRGPVEVTVYLNEKKAQIVCQNGTLAEPSSSGGWGMGLSIVRQICVRNKWTFDLRLRAGGKTQAVLS